MLSNVLSSFSRTGLRGTAKLPQVVHQSFRALATSPQVVKLNYQEPPPPGKVAPPPTTSLRPGVANVAPSKARFPAQGDTQHVVRIIATASAPALASPCGMSRARFPRTTAPSSCTRALGTDQRTPRKSAAWCTGNKSTHAYPGSVRGIRLPPGWRGLWGTSDRVVFCPKPRFFCGQDLGAGAKCVPGQMPQIPLPLVGSAGCVGDTLQVVGRSPWRWLWGLLRLHRGAAVIHYLRTQGGLQE